MSARALLLSLLTSATLVAPRAPTAQATATDTALRAGVRVRAVRIRGRAVTGALVSIADQGIAIATGEARTDTLAVASVSEMWRSRGAGSCTDNRAGCVLGGFLLGTVTGAGTGAGIGWLVAKKDQASHACPDGLCGLAVLAGLIVGGACGAATGTLIGATIGGERWQRIATPLPRVGLMQAPHGGVTLAWTRQF